MKKKLIVLFAMSMAAVLLAACGMHSKEQVIRREWGEEIPLYKLESYLLEKGVLSGEKTEADTEFMRAKAGFQYADSNVEIYEYDRNSSMYDILASGGSIGFDGKGPFRAEAVNGKYVLIATGEISQELRHAFANFDR